MPNSGAGPADAVTPVAMVALGLLPVGLVASCAASTQHAPVRRVTEAFFAAVRTHDGERGCGLLAPRATRSLESGGSACPEELDRLRLTGGTIRSVQVWSDRAQVVLSDDTVFLARFPQGWRVTAAGCERRSKGPYDCAVEA